MGNPLLAILAGVGLYLFSGLRVLREYERAVYFFLGRSWGSKGPGLIYLPTLFARMQKVTLRVMAVDIPPQDVITRDNISIKVNAVLYMRVQDPVKAVIGVENYLYATSQLAQTALRAGLRLRFLDARMLPMMRFVPGMAPWCCRPPMCGVGVLAISGGRPWW